MTTSGQRASTALPGDCVISLLHEWCNIYFNLSLNAAPSLAILSLDTAAPYLLACITQPTVGPSSANYASGQAIARNSKDTEAGAAGAAIPGVILYLDQRRCMGRPPDETRRKADQLAPSAPR